MFPLSDKWEERMISIDNQINDLAHVRKINVKGQRKRGSLNCVLSILYEKKDTHIS